MNSRGDTTTAYVLTWIIFTCLMLIVIFGSLFFWLDGKLYPPTNTFEAEAALLSQRLLYSPNALGYVDALTNRAMPGIIDKQKLIQPNIQDVLLKAIMPDKKRAARISIDGKVIYYDQATYNALQPQITGSGPGSTKQAIIKTVVLVHDGIKDISVPVEVEVLRVTG